MIIVKLYTVIAFQTEKITLSHKNFLEFLHINIYKLRSSMPSVAYRSVHI